MQSDLRAFAFNCTLKGARAKEKSSTDVLLTQIMDALKERQVRGEMVRAVDHDIKPGVSHDEGKGDAWPKIRDRMMAADIVVFGTPIWLGQPSSVCKRVLERIDAFIEDTDEYGRKKTYGKVALVAVVGNEDGAHHVSAELFQALNDCGFTIPANGMTYWVGEAMTGREYRDLLRTPKVVREATEAAVANAVHLARLLKQAPYPRAK